MNIMLALLLTILVNRQDKKNISSQVAASNRNIVSGQWGRIGKRDDVYSKANSIGDDWRPCLALVELAVDFRHFISDARQLFDECQRILNDEDALQYSGKKWEISVDVFRNLKKAALSSRSNIKDIKQPRWPEMSRLTRSLLA